jgi:TIR domain
MESVPLERKPRRVFLSYSHDSTEHRDRVLDLAGRLREDGVDARIDQYVEHEGHNWRHWSDEQIREADLVLMVVTTEYRKAVEGQAAPSERKGVVWEADRIYEEIYESRSSKDKFVPVLLDGASSEDIPEHLHGVSFFSLSTPDGYDKLFGRITGQARVRMKELGQLRSLPSLKVRAEQNPERYLNWLRGETGRVELDRLLDSPDQIPAPAIDSLYIHL